VRKSQFELMSRKRVFHKTQPKLCGALPMVKDHSFGLFVPCPMTSPQEFGKLWHSMTNVPIFLTSKV